MTLEYKRSPLRGPTRCESQTMPSNRLRFSSPGAYTILYILMAVGSITPSIAECNTTQWWTDPCNVQPTPPRMEKFRHGRSVRHKGIVIEQLDRAIIGIKEQLRNIERLYRNETSSVVHKRTDFKWLNATQMVQKINSNKKFKKKLRRLHPFLQRFAGALELLSCTPITSHGLFNKLKREHIIHEVKNHLRSLICEVKEALPPKFRRKIPLEKMHIGLPKQINLTDSYSYDVQIIKNLKYFLSRLKNRALKPKRKRIRTF